VKEVFVTSQQEVDAAFMTCEAIAKDQTKATGTTAYADGYRAAASRIAAGIRTRRLGLEPTQLERDLREAEMEARALARFTEVVRRRIGMLGDTEGGTALRALLFEIRGDEEILRVPTESGTLPIESGHPAVAFARRRRA
jgi:hypothetical protein